MQATYLSTDRAIVDRLETTNVRAKVKYRIVREILQPTDPLEMPKIPGGIMHRNSMKT